MSTMPTTSTAESGPQPAAARAGTSTRLRVITGPPARICDLAAWHALGRTHDRHRTVVLDLTGRGAVTVARAHAARLRGHTVRWFDLSDRCAPVRLFALPRSPWRARLAARVVQAMATSAGCRIESASLIAFGDLADDVAAAHPLGLRTMIRVAQQNAELGNAEPRPVPQRAAILRALAWGARFPAVWQLSEGPNEVDLRAVLAEPDPVVWLEARTEAFEPDEHRIVAAMAEAAVADAIRSVAGPGKLRRTVVHILPASTPSLPAWVTETAGTVRHLAAVGARQTQARGVEANPWVMAAGLVVDVQTDDPQSTMFGRRLRLRCVGASPGPATETPVLAVRGPSQRLRPLRVERAGGLQAVHVLRRRTAETHVRSDARQATLTALRVLGGAGDGLALYARLCSVEALRVGWQRISAAGHRAPGVDGQTVEDFRSGVEPELTRLCHELANYTYSPRPVRRTYVPKEERGTRPIGIASVRDKVVQAAAVALMEPRLELDFSPYSFAFRPGRNAHMAVAAAVRHLVGGSSWALQADVRDCYERLDHAILLDAVRRHLDDGDLVDLIGAWIAAGVVEDGLWTPRSVGTPQGLSVSPLLCNLYLDALDRYLTREGIPFVRYADDIALFGHSRADIEQKRATLETYLKHTLKLETNPDKTVVTPSSDGLPFLGFRVRPTGLEVEGKRLDRVVAHLRALIADIGSPETTPLTAGAVREKFDALVRGWRTYYLVADQPTLVEQLRGLDERVTQMASVLLPRAMQQDPAWENRERFVPDPTPEVRPPFAALAGVYATATPLPPVDAPAVNGEAAAAEVPRTDNHILDADGRLFVFAHGAHLRIRHGELIVTRRKGLLHQRSLEGLDLVHLEGRGQNLSIELELRLAELGVPIVLATSVGAPAAVLTPLDGGRARLRALQAVRRDDAALRRLATEMLAAKVGNQAAVLRYFLKYRDKKGESALVSSVRASADRIVAAADTLRGLDVCDPSFRQVAMGHEGQAAALYWQAVGLLVGPELLPCRETKGARTPLNAALNYAYGILYGEVWRAVVRAGLDPWFGVVHGSERDHGSLVFDLIEELRAPIIDRLIIAMVGRGFVPRVDDEGRLDRHTCRLVAQAVLRQRGRPIRCRRGTRTPASLLR
jgi:RNA-directed DNA polymerase